MSKQFDLSNEQRERQLNNSDEQYRLILENIRDHAIYMVDPDGVILTWNAGAERVAGYTTDEAVGTNFDCFYSEDSKSHAQTSLKRALELGHFESDFWQIRKDGTTFWANIVITPVFEKGKLIGYTLLERDLSERKVASENEEVFKLLVSSVGDYAIFMLDPKGYVKTWNEGAERIKGYKADQIIGKHFSTFYTEEAKNTKHPDHELEVAERTGRYEEEGWRVRKDGTQFFANVTITAIHQDGVLIGFAKVTRDLTERKVSEQQQEIFKKLVSGVKDYAIFMLNPEGNIVTWNDGAERIKGYTANEAIGKHFSVFYTKDAQKRKHPQNELEIARAQGRYEEEGWRVRKDGSLLWANVVITAIWADNKLIGFAKVTRDLTQRLLIDQEREASAKLLDETNTELRLALDVKSRFLSTVSHEVRTPMTAIIGMTEILKTEELGADNDSIVKSIFDASKRLLQLLNNLLESAQMESGNLTLERSAFPVRTVIGDVRQLVAHQAQQNKVRLTGTCADNVPEIVTGDELKIRQALLNLAHNAVKFTKDGEVNISAEIANRTYDAITVRFSVTDTGMGVAAAHRDKLFQPFSQAADATKQIYGGTGLGLSITKAVVELMGGSIHYAERDGGGSRFWFDVPFSTEGQKQQ